MRTTAIWVAAPGIAGACGINLTGSVTEK